MHLHELTRCPVRWLWFCAAMASVALTSPSAFAAQEQTLTLGPWRAWLESPGGELPFELELSRELDRYQAWIINGAERIEVPTVAVDNDRLVLGIDYYDSLIEAKISEDGRRLDGAWTKTGAKGTVTKMAFHARAGHTPRFARTAEVVDGSITKELHGRWSVHFSNGTEPAVGLFDADDHGRVTGTFLTATGDYRFLSGNVDGRQMKLSAFDGAHAFLFHAVLQKDNTLRGDFWSRDLWHETWTGRRDPEATLPDAFSLTKWTGGTRFTDLVFKDLEGKPRAVNHPAYAGRPRIIEVFGSWCPNCHDASEYLVELDRKYRARGLSIMALAFELTGDFQRDAAQLKKYIKHHKIEYPVLLAGVADKALVSKALPAIDRFRAYPTTFFVDRAGQVRAVHTGFSGPATGEVHRALRRRFESIIESMISESSSQ